ncbi:hypothetical protein FHS89_002613 [Rubricella aquisinus]|uniref:DUF2948 family protein n=1 Tax=Rubricella aquisinus TaxID=2028108 RepID=A0A840WSD8_9RHOB|nr:DUF2948 family protein [Rubricella aquisinus]MBB5516582.1 hypothetical protein [Rubricella aquisinus]
MTDATFEDGAERPVRLIAAEADDLKVISALVQDAVLTGGDITWSRKRRQFALLINRFRWEDRDAAARMNRPVERVRAMLVIDDALAVRAAGITPGEKDVVLSLLSIEHTGGEDGSATLTLIFAGDGEIAIDVEAINLTLADVTKPYRAPSGKTPSHD